MPNTFVLFALVAVGYSVTCDGTNGDAICVDTNKYIGKCNSSNSTCGATETCKGQAEHKICFEAGDDTLKGVCDGVSNKCKYTGVVEVAYSIAVPIADTAILGKMKTDATIFVPSLGSQMKESCEKRTFAVDNATFTCPEDHYFNNKQACGLSCTNSTHQLVAHTIKCDANSAWDGALGVCGKACPESANEISTSTGENGAAGSTNLYGEVTSTSLVFKKKVDHGTLTCFKHTAPETPCILTCIPGYRVLTASKHVCKDSMGNSNTAGAWDLSGDLGECQESKDVAASVSIVLSPGDDITSASGKAAFEEKFKNLVSTNISGVEALHVSVVKLTQIVNANARRLNERSVLVDYTIQAANGDLQLDPQLDAVDWTPEDGGAVGGGLRGIR